LFADHDMYQPPPGDLTAATRVQKTAEVCFLAVYGIVIAENYVSSQK
jgi:hypothetical protein